jgi:hypothetical protein
MKLTLRADRMRAEVSSSPGVTHHGYLDRLGPPPGISSKAGDSPQGLGGRIGVPSSPPSPDKAGPGGVAPIPVMGPDQDWGSARRWRRVYVVLGGGRLREYKSLRHARDDVVLRFTLTAQRGLDVRAARVVPPRARREWCIELEVYGLMKMEEVRGPRRGVR